MNNYRRSPARRLAEEGPPNQGKCVEVYEPLLPKHHPDRLKDARTGVKHNAYAPPLSRGQAATAHDYVNPSLPHVDVATGRHVTPPRDTTPGRAFSPARPASPTRAMKYGRPRAAKLEVGVRTRGRSPGSSKAMPTSSHFPYDARYHKYPYDNNRPSSPSNGLPTSRGAVKRPSKWVSEDDSDDEQEAFLIDGHREDVKKVRKQEPGGTIGSSDRTRRSPELPSKAVFQSMLRDLDHIVVLYQEKQAMVEDVL